MLNKYSQNLYYMSRIILLVVEMDKVKALDRLKRERDYEDALVQRLNKQIINRLQDISDITDLERDIITRDLTTILHESMRHEYLFGDLMQMVLEENEERQY